MGSVMVSEDVLAQLTELAARLDAQAAEIAAVKAENAELKAQVAHFAVPASAARAPEARTTPRVGRRGVLRKVLGATAAAALLTVARDAATAHAASRTNVLGPSTSAVNYGLAAAPSSIDPQDRIGNVPPASAFRAYGVIGVESNPNIVPPDGAGVLGQANGFYGVIGLSSAGVGVYGQATSNVGVRGESASSIGVLGASASVYGVNGVSTSGAGVFGLSNTGFGVYGYSYGSGGNAVGLYGVANSGEGLVGLTQTGIGVHGNAIQASGLAGRFDGRVLVSGTLTVTGGLTTSAIASPDGSYRQMYSQESPEPWIEDFGTATLQGGRAEIALDPALDAVVEATEYLVFLTPKGIECGPLFVSRQGEHNFEVRSYAGPLSSGSFDYRVVARRRDVPGKRLEQIPAANINLGKDSPPPPAPRTAPDTRLAPNGPTLRPDASDRPQP